MDEWVHCPATDGWLEVWYVGNSRHDARFLVINQGNGYWLLLRIEPWKTVPLSKAEYTAEQALALCPLLTRID